MRCQKAVVENDVEEVANGLGVVKETIDTMATTLMALKGEYVCQHVQE